MNFTDPKIETLHKYRRCDAIAGMQSIKLNLILDGIVHGHGFHPAFDFLTIDLAMCAFGSSETIAPSSLYCSMGANPCLSVQAHSASASSNIERNLCGISSYYCWPAAHRSHKCL